MAVPVLAFNLDTEHRISLPKTLNFDTSSYISRLANRAIHVYAEHVTVLVNHHLPHDVSQTCELSASLQKTIRPQPERGCVFARVQKRGSGVPLRTSETHAAPAGGLRLPFKRHSALAGPTNGKPDDSTSLREISVP